MSRLKIKIGYSILLELVIHVYLRDVYRLS